MSCPFAFLVLIAALLVGGTACQKQRSVIERDPTQDPLLAVRFNASDAQQVAQANIEHLAQRPFFQQFQAAQGRKPIIVFGGVRDLSYPGTSTEFLTNPIMEFFVNESVARVISERDLRDAVRMERLDTEFTNPDFIKAVRNELGADFILFGELTNDEERATNRNSPTLESNTYLVNLRLLDVETLEVVWDNPSNISMVRKDFGR